VLVVAGPVGGAEHEVEGHPERPARIGAAMAGIDDLHLGTDLVTVVSEPAPEAGIARVHDADYLALLDRVGQGWLDADTYVTPDSVATARRAAGAGLAAAAALRTADAAGVGFVVARPPGHHALADRGMGFCLLNNIAITAAELAAQGERVLIVDWDVHHGNGTQAIFWDDPRVLFVSTHQWPAYPGTGSADETGGPGAPGLTVNVPLPPGATGDVVRAALDEVAGPAVARFAPTWTLVSAGYDAHRDDPLADLALSDGDFAALASTVRPYSAGPMLLFLEGGYDLAALRASVAATCGALLGTDAATEAQTSGGPGMEAVEVAKGRRERAIEEKGER
jgi:acetoin utilization deacetylase AcuC-like enzyme